MVCSHTFSVLGIVCIRGDLSFQCNMAIEFISFSLCVPIACLQYKFVPVFVQIVPKKAKFLTTVSTTHVFSRWHSFFDTGIA